jgi:hypothetical protein
MTTNQASQPAAIPVRYGCAGSPVPSGERACPLCGAGLPSARARYCSDACKQRAYRRRLDAPTSPAATTAPSAPAQRAVPANHTVYECPTCEQRYVGERRCPDCNHFCRKLGRGGGCPHCDEPVLIAELLGMEVLL